MNWAVKKERRTYEVVVWSNQDQRVTDRVSAESYTDALELCSHIKAEADDGYAWVIAKLPDGMETWPDQLG